MNVHTADDRPDLIGLPRARLAKALKGVIDRPFRSDQIYRALYERGATEFDAITELSRDLRANLNENFVLQQPEIAKQHRSADGTTKYLLRLVDGVTIEMVDIPEGKRRTLCVSSQAGCALACRFCVTGFWGGGRNLSAGEIINQVLLARRLETENEGGLNIVFMGMGEPLLNLPNLADALEILMEQISWRRITVSTAGVIPGILEMASWPKRPRLAISLHAPDDARRDDIMPINKRYPLKDLMAALEAFPLAAKERITFEYILIRDFNDAEADADLLVRLLHRLQAKVNLIPLNPDPVLGKEMKAPPPARVEAFRHRLIARGLMATTRKQRGDDVSAACGQLRAPEREPRGFQRSNLRF